MTEGFSADFLRELDLTQKEKVKSFVTNFKIDAERIEDVYEAIKYTEQNFGTAEILRAMQ